MTMAAAKLPRKIWIGTYEVSVQSVPPNSPKLDPIEPGEETRLRGMFDPDVEPPEIFVDQTLGGIQLLEIINHEITHAINYVYDIQDGAQEEDVAETHGRAWSMFYVANPRYQRWLVSLCNAIRKEQKDA
jgi:hypothetical protein